MWELDNKEGRAPKDWCFQTVVLEKTLESFLESKEIKPVNLFLNIYIYFFFLITFFAIHWHESAMGIHVFPILNPPPTSLPLHPSGSSQCTSPEDPVSCSEPGLAIYFTYGSIHVSVLFSQIIPPSPSPTERKFRPKCKLCMRSRTKTKKVFVLTLFDFVIIKGEMVIAADISPYFIISALCIKTRFFSLL